MATSSAPWPPTTRARGRWRGTAASRPTRRRAPTSRRCSSARSRPTPPSPASPPVRRRGERGFALVIVLAGITVMMILMTAAAPTWRYLSQDDKEQELFFRGDQIARGIEEYQRKNGNTFPASFE